MSKSTVAAGLRLVLSGSLVVSAAALLSGCASSQKFASRSDVEPIERVVGPHDRVTPGGGRYQVGKAYSIGGRTYVPREDPNYDATGIASWYGGDFHHGTRTANGEVYDRHTISAAHPTMPLPSYARVTNTRTGRSIIVRVNDRGPYAANRIIDISEKTAELLDMKRHGLGQVRVQYVGRAGLAGSDQTMLAATLRGPGVTPAGDEQTMLAQADLPIGPRRNLPAAATLIADARPTVPASAGAIAPQRVASFAPPKPVNARAYAATPDPFSIDLAGVDSTALRAAAKAGTLRPASTSAEVIASELPGASGAPMSILPAPGSLTTSSLAPQAPARASYAAESRIAAAHGAFAHLGDGAPLGTLAE